MQQKNYRLLRFLQFILSLLGWLFVLGGVLIGFSMTGLSVLSGDVAAVGLAFVTALGVTVGTISLGLTYLIAAQLIEVFVDMASNTQRTAYLLEHMINHWPATAPAALDSTGNVPMPTITMAQTPG